MHRNKNVKKNLLAKLIIQKLHFGNGFSQLPRWFSALLFVSFQMFFAQEATAITVIGGAQIIGASQMRYAHPTPKNVYKKNIKKTCVETSARKRTKKSIETVKKLYTYGAIKFDLAKQDNTGNSQISNGKYASNCATPGSSYQNYGVNDSVHLHYSSAKFLDKPIELEQHFKYFEYRGKKRNKSPPAIRVI